jgi:hypothetical protein
VTVSRLTTLPVPCQGPASACACPWEIEGECAYGCAADGVELVVDRPKALAQLCAPGPDSGVFALVPAPTASGVVPSSVGSATAADGPDACDEGERYRCVGGHIVDCASGSIAARCTRGCFAEATSIDDDDVKREVAFAMLCSR